MRVFYKPAFLKDLKRLNGTPVYGRVYKLAFVEAESWETLADVPGIKRLSFDSASLMAALSAKGGVQRSSTYKHYDQGRNQTSFKIRKTSPGK